MRSIMTLRRAAYITLGSASYDLQQASTLLMPHDREAGSRLMDTSAFLYAYQSRLERGHSVSPDPTHPDAWLVAAGRLHDVVSDITDAVVLLWERAEQERRIVAVPDGGEIDPDDEARFGFRPTTFGFCGWTAPQDAYRLQRLLLPVGSQAWHRRLIIMAAVNRWGREYQAAVVASGVVPLQECIGDLYSVLASLRGDMAQVSGSTVAAARALANVAARSLAEIGDDVDDLSGLARAYAAEQGGNTSTAFAWRAVAALLDVSRDATPARKKEKI